MTEENIRTDLLLIVRVKQYYGIILSVTFIQMYADLDSQQV